MHGKTDQSALSTFPSRLSFDKNSTCPIQQTLLFTFHTTTCLTNCPDLNHSVTKKIVGGIRKKLPKLTSLSRDNNIPSRKTFSKTDLGSVKLILCHVFLTFSSISNQKFLT